MQAPPAREAVSSETPNDDRHPRRGVVPTDSRQRTAGTVQAEPAASLAAIKVLFKMDPRLTRSLYMGDRWVSPPTYTGVQQGTFTVDAVAKGSDAQGRTVKVNPQWIPDDGSMVTVAPGQGPAVVISVQRAGQTRLRVVSGGVTKTLEIRATRPADSALQVNITQ